MRKAVESNKRKADNLGIALWSSETVSSLQCLFYARALKIRPLEAHRGEENRKIAGLFVCLQCLWGICIKWLKKANFLLCCF